MRLAKNQVEEGQCSTLSVREHEILWDFNINLLHNILKSLDSGKKMSIFILEHSFECKEIFLCFRV